MLLDVPHAVVGEVAHQHLPPQVEYFIHHVPKSVEQIPLVLLPEWDGKEKGRQIDRKERRNEEDGLVGIWLERRVKK